MLNNKDYTSKGIISNTFFSIASKVVPILISLVCIPIIINGLGEEKYGAFTVALVFIGYFNLFDLGLGRAITKLISERIGKDKDQEIADIFKTGVTLTLVLGVVGGIIFYLVSEPITIRYLKPPKEFINEVIRGLTFLAIGIPFAIMINSYRGVLEALHEFKSITWVQIILGASTYVGVIMLMEFTTDLAYIIAYLSGMKIIHFLTYRKISNSKLETKLIQQNFDKTYINQLFSFGGWITVSTIVSPIMTALDRLIVASKEGMESVAYYSTASEITQRVGVLPSALVSVLFPVFSRNQNFNDDQNSRIYKASFNLMLLGSGIFAIGFICFGKDFLAIWISEGFANKSYFVLQIITVGALFNFLARIPFSFIQGVGRPDITAKFHIIELPVFLALLFVLTDRYGIIGAAFASSIRMILDFILLHIYAVLKFKVDHSLLPLILGAVLPTIIGFYIASASLSIGAKSGYTILLSAGLTLIFWVFIFDDQLRKRILNTLKMGK
ncbi:MAG: flippase [Balneola sp.]